jgi:hypothetical protein
MKKTTCLYLVLSLVTLVARPVLAQPMTSPPPSKEELDAVYNTGVETRTVSILKKLNLTDSDKSNSLHDIIVAQYHSLRTRDEAIDAKLKAQGQDITYANRASQLADTSKPLHDDFINKLNGVLTPDQVDQVKDLMTYNKVTFTYSAYCNIVPNLTDEDKAKIMDLLKQAREEAIDGGSAPEKSQIFQKYKDQIDAYLNAHGHDVAKAKADWAAAHTTADASANAAPASK